MRASTIAAVLLAAGAALAGCASSAGSTDAGAPPASGPTSAPSSPGGGITVTEPSPVAAGVSATWIPNGNWQPATRPLTRGNGDRAKALLADIHAASRAPKGPISCPADFGTGVDLRIATTMGVKAEQVRLSGCAGVQADDGTVRVLDAALRRDLLPLAPARWRSALR
jgi:hypothetical protein